MVTPTVSVVMCVYNGERCVAEAIESILAQTMRDFEFVIVDDGSTDGTNAILRHQLHRSRVLCPHEDPPGLAARAGSHRGAPSSGPGTSRRGSTSADLSSRFMSSPALSRSYRARRNAIRVPSMDAVPCS